MENRTLAKIISFVRKQTFIITVSAIFSGALFFVLSKVLEGKIILPQEIHLGFFTLRFYGIIIALAAFASYRLAKKRQSDYGYSDAESDNLLFVLLIGGFIGARLYHVFSDFHYYLAHPLLIPAIWHGGLGIYGALFGGMLTIWLYFKYWKKREDAKASILNTLDWLVPSLVIGQAIGRFGNLFNYEAYGYPTSSAWRMFVPAQFRLPPYETYQYFHPLFLYESLASAIILAILLYLSPKLREGKLFFLWLILYNSVRLIIEAFRIDSVLIYGFRLNMIVSVILILVGANAFHLLYDNKVASDN